MTLTVGLLVTADAKGAKAELAATAGEAKKLGTATGAAGKEARGAAGGVTALGTASSGAAARATALANAEAAAGANALRMGQNHRIAAGQVGNLTAQFNDIGVMLAAGQNPLQLALQQGTQITQVIGPMGAAGAVKALSSAFLGMINPVSLITIGSIAAGAAMIQWLTGAGEEVPTLEKALDQLAEAVSAYTSAADLALASSEKLTAQFGSQAEGVKRTLDLLQNIALAKAMDGLNVSMSQLDTSRLRELVDIVGDGKGEVDAFNDNYKRAQRELTEEFALSKGEATGLLGAIENMAAAKGPENIAEASRRLNGLLLTIYGTVQNIPPKFRDMAEGAAKVDVAASEIIGTLEGIAEASSRLVKTANADAEAMIATLLSEASIRAQILLFGQDSELVAQNRLAAERDILSAQMETEGVAADVAARVLEAWDAAKGFNGEAAGMSGFLSSAAAEAAAMAGNIWNALGAMVEVRKEANKKLAQMSVEFSPGGQALKNYGSRTPGGTSAQNALETRNEPAKARVGRKSGGGRKGGSGTSEIEKQQKALDELIKREERELELLRETDPIGKELLRNREALAGATDVERAKVEELITTRIRETEAMERMQWVSQQTGNALIDALMGGKGAGEQLIDTLKRAVLQAAILGEGPLGGLFGGGSIFKSIGSLFGGGGDLFANIGGTALATGGMVHGPGTGTSDDINAKLSNGEFVVNAKSTARYRHQLEAMNSGSPLPSFAAGGMMGGGATPMLQGGGDVMEVSIDLRGTQGDAAIEASAYKAMQRALQEWDRKVLPRRMQELRRDPRRIG